jgi:hypothetical protein
LTSGGSEASYVFARQKGYSLKVLCVLSASDKKDAARVYQLSVAANRP